MMVALACQLIARRFPWKIDRNQPTFVDQRLDGSIDCGDPKAGHVTLRACQHFGSAQGTVGVLKDIPDDGALPSLPGFLVQIQALEAASIPLLLADLYHYAWFIGFAVAFAAYLIGRKLAPEA